MQKENEERSDLLTRSEAAQFLRLSPGTLANWMSNQKQKIPCVKLGGRIYYQEASLKKWIAKQAINAMD